MPRTVVTKPRKIDINIFSRSRKNPYFMVVQKYSGGRLFIDGKKMGFTTKDHGYAFHIVNGKIDHWYRVHPSEISEERECINDTDTPPSDWCDECYNEVDYASDASDDDDLLF